MKRAILTAAALAVAAVIAWNAWMAFRLMTAPVPSGGAPSASSPSAAPATARAAVSPSPSPSLSVPASSPPSLQGGEREEFTRFFLISEVALHLSLRREMFEQAGGAAPLAALAGLDEGAVEKMLGAADLVEVIETPAGGRYACFHFDGEASDALAKMGLGADNMRGLVALEGGRAWFASGGEPVMRIRRNDFVPEGKGSYRDEVGDVSAYPFFFRATRARLDFGALPFFADLAARGSEVRVSFSGGVSKAAVKWADPPEWVGSLEVGPDMRKVGFCDVDARFFVEVSTAGGKAAGKVAGVLAAVLGGGKADEFARDFERNTGMSPAAMAERFCGGRIFVWQPGGTEESDEIVFGFELERGRTAEELIEAMKPGEAFGGEDPLVMVYRGRKIFFRDDGGEPGFSVGLLDGVVLMSGSNESLRRAVDVRTRGEGDFSFLPPALLGTGDAKAPVLIHLFRGTAGVPEWLFGSGPRAEEVWLALAFKRRWFEVRTLLPPALYLPALLREAARNVRP